MKFILLADIHIRETNPVCRKDSYLETLTGKMEFVKSFGLPVLISGDVFEHWKGSPYQIGWAMEHLPQLCVTCFGNHDLPYHGMDRKEYSALYVLHKMKRVMAGNYNVIGDTLIVKRHWDMSDKTFEKVKQKAFQNSPKTNRKALLSHEMVVSEEKYQGEGENALKLLKKYKDFDLIITGHNHKRLYEKYQNRVLLNPGSIMRGSSDLKEQVPMLTIWDTKDMTFKTIPIPYEKGNVSEDHLIQHESNYEIGGFKINKEEIGVSFQDNLNVFFKQNKTKEGLQKLVNTLMEV